MTLLDQFLSGNCEQVWRQIVEERRPADDAEAVAVAEETVLRARDNLRTIYERLVELGYDFAEPDDAFVTTTPEEAADEIGRVEARFGALPGLVRLWYSHIRSVNFAQTEAQCCDPNHVLKSLGRQPLAIYLSLDRCCELAAEKHAEYRDWWEKARACMDDDRTTSGYFSQLKTPDEMDRFLPLGSFASNCDHKGFTLPCDLMDTEFFDDGELTHFNEDLRYVILSGCFPALGVEYFRGNVPDFMKFGHPDPDALLGFLTNDLKPI
jgi:hypothetical protein